jgi:hypothetical protein
MGAAGIGKTSLALSVMHSQLIAEHYTAKYFIPCEAVTTYDDLFSEIADALHLPCPPPEERSPEFFTTIVTVLISERTLICFDNFDTPWEANPETRKTFDSFLRYFDNLNNVGIILTMRGTASDRPNSLTWSEPLLPPLRPISDPDRDRIFMHIAHQKDGCADKLLKEVGGVPLALQLLARSVQGGMESSEGLWKRWGREHLRKSGDNCLSTLDTTIQLSIDSPHMKDCPTALDVLSLLSLLPTGFPEQSLPRHLLLNELSSDFPFTKSIETLKTMGLIYIDRFSRYRLLPPIRQYCVAHHPVTDRMMEAACKAYFLFISEAQFSRGNLSFHAAGPERLDLENAKALISHARCPDLQGKIRPEQISGAGSPLEDFVADAMQILKVLDRIPDDEEREEQLGKVANERFPAMMLLRERGLFERIDPRQYTRICGERRKDMFDLIHNMVNSRDEKVRRSVFSSTQ